MLTIRHPRNTGLAEALQAAFRVPFDHANHWIDWVDGPSLSDVSTHLTRCGYTVFDSGLACSRYVVVETGWEVTLTRLLRSHSVALELFRTCLDSTPDWLDLHDALVNDTTLPAGGAIPADPVEEVALQLILDRVPNHDAGDSYHRELLCTAIDDLGGGVALRRTAAALTGAPLPEPSGDPHP